MAMNWLLIDQYLLTENFDIPWLFLFIISNLITYNNHSLFIFQLIS